MAGGSRRGWGCERVLGRLKGVEEMSMRQVRLRTCIRSASVVVIPLLALSCHIANSANKWWEHLWSPRQDKVASVQIAAVSIAPWDQYRDAIQPVFKLTADDALKQVVPTTQSLDERIFDAVSAR